MNPHVILGNMFVPDGDRVRDFFRGVGNFTEEFYGKYFQSIWNDFFREVYRIFFWVTLGILVLDIILFVIKQVRADGERTLAVDLGKNLLAVVMLIVGYLTLLVLIGFAFYLIGIMLLGHLFFGTPIDSDTFSDEDETEDIDDASE